MNPSDNKTDKRNHQRLRLEDAREKLQAFEFSDLFIEVLGWNHPETIRPKPLEVEGQTYLCDEIAELSGFRVYEIRPKEKGAELPDAKTQDAIHKRVAQFAAEHILIFVDAARRATVWHWTKRENGRKLPRRHVYIKGQPGDLFLSKLSAMVVDLSELDEQGNLGITEAARRVQAALDIETVTRRFFDEFKEEHDRLLDDINGIPDEHDQRWYASVILNRLMFIWFLQKKYFLDQGRENYLPDLYAQTLRDAPGTFFSHTLRDLFFEGFAKPSSKRRPVGEIPLGDIPYLNGGLFLPHGIEARMEGEALFTGPFSTISISDASFSGIFTLFGRYSWNLNDTPGGNDQEINPDVLGYIFEKYINQKEFGAYYTRPEITEYLCEQTIHQLVLEAANRYADGAAQLYAHGLKKGAPPRRFETISDILLHAEGPVCRHLLQDAIPRLSLLDPACGSGAFIVAALRTLLGLTTALIGRCEAIGERTVLKWIEREQKKHKAPLAYWVKKKIITENLYGVDIMEEAVEIAKLRLFLALVASAEHRDQLEPLPNIEFNLMPGNSLIGLLDVDGGAYDSKSKAATAGGTGSQGRLSMVHEPGPGMLDMVVETTVAPDKDEAVRSYLAKQRGKKYDELLREKNRLVDLYKGAGDWSCAGEKRGELKELTGLREQIEAANQAARGILNELLLKEFQGLGIQYEQATWDATKGKEGKRTKRPLTLEDIEALHPFHWAYEFDEIMVKRGGFDAIITNPPWEVFKPNAKEFFLQYSDLIQRKKMRVEDFNKAKKQLLKDPEILVAWLDYLSCFPHLSRWFRDAPQFTNQIGVVNGRKVGSDLNLYKLFLEQTTHLLRDGGRTGIVIPSGIYTDLGAMQLRNMLFDTCRITGLFGFENRKKIFDNVDSRFKFVVLTFVRGGQTEKFPTAFMRKEAKDLLSFPHEIGLTLPVPLIRQLSPGSGSIMEFQSGLDVQIAEKMLRHPLLGEEIENSWNVSFTAEFHMTNDSDLFHTRPGEGRLPLYEGKMIWQFQHGYAEPRYWVDEKQGRKRIAGKFEDKGGLLDYQSYRMGFRDIARNTDRRTLISTIIPPTFHGNKLPTVKLYDSGKRIISLYDQMSVCVFFNSFSLDWFIRQKITTTINFFYLHQLPMPRLCEADRDYRPLVERAARLVGTTADFDDLLKEVFGPKASHKTHGVTDTFARQTLRAEIDALVARLYDLTEKEFAHILGTFPLVDESVKSQTLNTYRDLLKLGKLPDTRL